MFQDANQALHLLAKDSHYDSNFPLRNVLVEPPAIIFASERR